jgi:hypothetical protein
MAPDDRYRLLATVVQAGSQGPLALTCLAGKCVVLGVQRTIPSLP